MPVGQGSRNTTHLGGLGRPSLFDTNIKATSIDEDIFTDQEAVSAAQDADLVLILDVSETPDKIKYMTKTNFIGEGLVAVSNNTDNYLATMTGSALNGEANLTFDGTTLNVESGEIQIDISSGDPHLTFQIGNSDTWTMGADDSDSDKFKINSTGALVDASDLILDSSGNLTLKGGITVGDSVSAMTDAGLLSVANQSNITGLGTIATGTWEGTTVAVAQGGTGATTLSNLIALGTHTTGGYVTAVTAGTGINTTGATSGESISHSISIDLDELGEVAIADGDYIPFMDTTDSNASKKEAVGDLATLFAGTGLTASSSVIGVDASQAITALTGGDLTLYEDANNADVSFKMGTSATEALSIEVLNGGSDKINVETKIMTTTADGTGNYGKISVYIDEVEIFDIDDGGIDMASGKTVAIDGTDLAGDTTYTAGDGLGLSGTEFSTDLVSNGGLEIQSAELSVAQGISQYDVAQFAASVADNDFLRIDGTAVEGRSASEVLSDISASPVAGSSSIVTTGALDTGSITSGFTSIDVGSGAISTTGAVTTGDITVSGGDITYGNGQNATASVAAVAHNAAGKTLTITSGPTTAGTSNNQAGGALTLQGGQGKGSGAGGAIVFQVANAGASGSSLNSLATALTIDDAGSLILDGDKSVTPGDGSMIHLDTSTITDSNTSGSGTAAKYTHVTLEAPTLAATNSSVTTSDAATLYINAAATAGTNQTITRNWAMWVDTGNARFDGSIYSGTTEAISSAGLVTVVNQSNITGLGTISSGTWEGTTVAVDQGGTGATSLTANGVLIGNGTSAIASVDMSTKGKILIGDGSSNPQMLAVGDDDQILTADSGETTGVKWAAAASGVSLSGSTDNTVATVTGSNALAGEANLTYDGTDLAAASSSAGKPVLTLKTTHTTKTSSSELQFLKDAADTEDGEQLGQITFYGEDEGNNNTQFAEIVASISESDEGDEAGILELKVAESDSTTSAITTGLKLEGEHATDGEIDVTIGAGTASTTTIAGTLTMGSTAAMTNAGLLSVGAQTGITQVGTIAAGTWNGTAIVDAYVADALTISGGTVDNSVIGGSTAAAITGTTITANTSVVADANGGADLGTTSVGWGDVFVADDKAIKFGDGQDASIEYDEDGTDELRIAGNTVFEDSVDHTLDVHFDSSPTDETVSGITATFQAGETLVRGEVVYFKAGDSKMWKAVASAAATSRCVAMAAADISADANGKFLMRGFLADNGTFPAYTVGGVLYTPEAEQGGENVPEQAAPDSDGDFVQVLGFAVTANSVYFDPSNDIIEHTGA